MLSPPSINISILRLGTIVERKMRFMRVIVAQIEGGVHQMPMPSMQQLTQTRFLGLCCQAAAGVLGYSKCLPSRVDTMPRLPLQSSRRGSPM